MMDSEHTRGGVVTHTEDGYAIGRCRFQRRNLLIACVALALLVVVIVPIAVLVPNKGTDDTSEANKAKLRAHVKEWYDQEENPIFDESKLLDKSSPQYKAFKWMEDGHFLKYNHAHRLQRYVLACFYYATNGVATKYTPDPPKWRVHAKWLTDTPVCGWEGIDCNGLGLVTKIALPRHHLTGSLPPELGWIDSLESLRLTTNFLHIESETDLAVLGLMKSLKVLLIDDNYVVSAAGLPESLGNLEKLEKLTISYNLLSGPLNNGVLENLQKLTHLEVESNGLTGEIPPVLGEMENMAYLYARRNALNSDLSFLKAGKMSSLFAMWLDSNEVQGTIPTEIGLLSKLAGLSLTDNKLVGTLPTEIGNVQRLQRMWIYKNELEGAIPTEISRLGVLHVFEAHGNNFVGTMPPAFCKRVEILPFTHTSVTADCDEVACEGCCTECYDSEST